ncbi:MAG: hydroxyisourate hydrolase [Planctomycetota bacterium]|nr:MAG: hydroxyisourate hydrolase [Planctomycetota bacterium]
MLSTRFSLLVLVSSIGLWATIGRFAGSEEKPAATSTLSTHVLNTTTGKPASGVTVMLQRQAGLDWQEVKRAETDGRGRVSDFYLPGKPLPAGTYRLVFETGKYFKSQGTATFFPRVEILFAIEKTDEHYHVPLLISPYGYSTYRGS